jgi:hypothetical protein
MSDETCRRCVFWVLAGLALLCVLIYYRALWLPFIADDYVQIRLGREYGPAAGWQGLAHDALYRCRATSILVTHWTERLFGLQPFAYNASSLVFHTLNTWLVFALGAWRLVGWRVSAAAAAFFAIHEGHQEAVIWYAALPELLVFTFGLLSVIFWVLWLQSDRSRWYAASFAAFLFALASKESGVVVVPLVVAVWWFTSPRRISRLLLVLPYAASAVIYAIGIYAARSSHLFFHDGTFSLSAPFWIANANSTVRLLWIWGFLALAAIALWARDSRRQLLIFSALWIPVTFLPYSFLTYMTRVPSRHTYFASAGLALIVAMGFLALWSFRRAVPAVAALLVILHNAGYVWTRKHEQYAERAASTEALVEFLRNAKDPVYITCFPYGFEVADLTAQYRLGRKVSYAPPGAKVEGTEFCWTGK